MEKKVVALEQTVKPALPRAVECQECHGTGIVNHHAEFSHLEDRRACTRCDAGRSINERIAEIVARAQAEER